jgi:DNA-binding LytR/AlgR family response regulator
VDKLEIPCKTSGVEIIEYKNIIYIRYDKPYCIFVYREQLERRTLLVQLSLIFIEEHLSLPFVRCNLATIVNLDYIKKINYNERYILMEDGKKIYISRRRMPNLRKQKEKHSYLLMKNIYHLVH